ncbi:MAG: class I SAM-dependent methyltransferase [Candidatus Hodarchaeales archaeon]|jgi:ubiquinone/menaquinone biosynthesis C-methylase UbiE
MDWKELKLMNSPFKALMQRYFEFVIFKRFLKFNNLDLSGKAILEAGCGSGYGLELISKQFHPSDLVGFDILADQVDIARKRNTLANLFVGDVRNINLQSESFDVVFAFTVFHHVEGWRKALGEVNRVLKVNGLLLVNELNKRFLDRIERYLKVDHPERSRFDWIEFRQGLVSAGFRILKETLILMDFGFFMCQKVREPSS